MITTRQVNVNLDRGKVKLRHVTTKDIDVGVRVEPPKEPIKKKSIATITTTTLPDVADMAEKKRRDDIAAEKKAITGIEIETAISTFASLTLSDEDKKLEIKDEKKITMAEKRKANGIYLVGEEIKLDEEGFKKLNTQFAFVDIDDLVQAVSRRELK